MTKNLKNTYGSLVTTKLSQCEKKNLIACLDKLNPDIKIDFLESVFGSNFLKFFDIYSGETFTVPKREKISRLVLDIKIYTYCSQDNFSEKFISNAVVRFGKDRFFIKRALNRIRNLIEQDKGVYNEREKK